MTRFRLVILGNGSGGLSALNGLLPLHPDLIEVVAVYPWSLHPKGCQDYFMPEYNGPFVHAAKAQGITLLSNMTCCSDAFAHWLVKNRIDGLMVFAWGEIFKGPLLQLSLPIINMHPSLLPHHRGFNPFVSVISQGDTETGVTFHQIVDTGIDTGPIILQANVPVLPDDTGGDLQIRCEAKAQALMPQVANWFLNPVPGQAQVGQGSYFAAPLDTDACLNWALPPEVLCRKARALQPWLMPYTFIDKNTPVKAQHVKMRTGLDTGQAIGQCVQLTADVLSIQSSQPGTVIDLVGYQLGRGAHWLSLQDSFDYVIQLMQVSAEHPH
jgi:methionyl-tRNA formyltransferase